jgi:hypothetical protein
MKRTFKGTAGYSPVKRAIKGSTPSVARRYMRVVPLPGPTTPAAAGWREDPMPAGRRPTTASRRRGVTAQQQREANEAEGFFERPGLPPVA